MCPDSSQIKGLNRKDLLGISDLDRTEIELILNTAISLKEILERPIKVVPYLRGKTAAFLFFEPSTRTLHSFSLAARRLSCDFVSVSASSSSVLKGETLLDTAKNLEAMKLNFVVVRHSSPGASHNLARNLRASIINAGDGCHEHPTQALLDLLTIREHFGRFNGLKIAIVGDIEHSRVARSNIYGMSKLGMDVSICGPPTLIPRDIEKMGVKVYYDLKKAIKDKDIIYVLRIQKERQSKGLFPSTREYIKLYSITEDILEKYAKDDVIIMHPGPVNRGLEISVSVADSSRSLILPQVTNGVAVRMACFYLLPGGEGGEKSLGSKA
ncbi:aspartate carbamoyltransferase catalytic subunit [candidate division WOR-3 bacterium]|nr:aspartate carbamoyltransferase catalytic subunit [candidate division WOR-3 bacterium]